jgi:hypothetical protein
MLRFSLMSSILFRVEHKPIWQDRRLKPLHYRLLWWLLDMGAAGGLLGRGWMLVASMDLGVHRITLNRALKRLVSEGIVVAGRKGSFGVRVESLESDADQTRVYLVGARGQRI